MLSRSIKFPYGCSFFHSVRERGCFWRDTSKYVSAIAESGTRHQLFLRPPRFGKSLNLSQLYCYPDINQEKNFDKLFIGTEIYERKHELQHNSKYHVMTFNFTVDTGNGDPELIAARFRENISFEVKHYCNRYSIPFPTECSDPLVALREDC